MFSGNAGLSMAKSAGRPVHRYMGIVTNGDGWQFYKLTQSGEVYETLLYGLGNQAQLLGLLIMVLKECEAYVTLKTIGESNLKTEGEDSAS